MAPCARRVAMAAMLSAAALLLLAVCSAPPVSAHVGEWLSAPAAAEDESLRAVRTAAAGAQATFTGTPMQRTHTLRVLQAFAAATPSRRWRGTNFCAWAGVKCYDHGVRVRVVDDAGTGALPDLPDDVDYTQVSLSALIVLRDGAASPATLPASWGRLQQLNKLVVSGAGLSGTLPAEWGSLSSLQSLVVQAPNVAGTLPREWASLSSLRALAVDGARVSGTLPPEWASLSALRALLLNGTQVSGTLPAVWELMSRLEWLQLSHSAVSGTLPGEWSSMASLRHVDLQGNALRGELPASWSQMRGLHTVLLEHNGLSGCVPASWAGLRDVDVVVDARHRAADCAGDTTPAPLRCLVANCATCRAGSATQCARCQLRYHLTGARTCMRSG